MIKTIAQRSLIAGAVLAMTAGLAQAQSVTLFGRIDVGIEHVTKVFTAPGVDDSLTKVQNGGILPSIWGMRGSEDLGGGLKAVFNLESDFSGDTGGSRGLGNISTLFGRQANVGVSGGFGTVLLGRQYSPAILAELGTDPRGYKESFSMLLPYALTQLPAGNTGVETPAGPNGLGIFTSNLISYSNAFGPVSIGLGYGLGEQVGNNSAGRTFAGGLTFTGPVVVSLSYQAIKGIGAGVAGGGEDETTRFGVGVAVPLGPVKIKALYARSEYEDNGAVSTKTKFDNWGVGVDFGWAANNTLTAAYYQGKQKDGALNGKAKDFVISNDLALSKRTTLYVQFVHTDFDANANTALSIAADRYGALNRGEKSSIFGAGIKHDF